MSQCVGKSGAKPGAVNRMKGERMLLMTEIITAPDSTPLMD
jgi:hypothetical protein